MPPDSSRLSAPLRVRLAVPAGLVVLITLIGTVGYAWLGRDQGATLLDALFMTVITITTIGYGEVIRLDAAGRVFTMVIAITGIGSLFYSLTVIMEYLVSSRILDPFGERKCNGTSRTSKTISSSPDWAGWGGRRPPRYRMPRCRS